MSRPNLEILACEETKLGLICLRRRELLSRPGTVVTEITLNQEFLMSSYITESERALARIALQDHHGDELNVLIGGLGLGYTAQEVLESARVVRVDVVELLPQVVGWLDRGLVPLAAELRADSRLFVAEGDVYACLSLPPRRLSDLILIDVDHSPSERLGDSSADFYTAPGLALAKRHLKPNGILAVWSYAEQSAFADALRCVFSDVKVVPVTVWNDLVDEEQTDWLFFAADGAIAG